MKTTLGLSAVWSHRQTVMSNFFSFFFLSWQDLLDQNVLPLRPSLNALDSNWHEAASRLYNPRMLILPW